VASGAIIGIAVGGSILVVLIIILGWWWRRRVQYRRRETAALNSKLSCLPSFHNEKTFNYHGTSRLYPFHTFPTTY
jgi:hypothetical protein